MTSKIEINLNDYTFVARNQATGAMTVIACDARDTARLLDTSSKLFAFVSEGHAMPVTDVPADLVVEFSSGGFDFLRCGATVA